MAAPHTSSSGCWPSCTASNTGSDNLGTDDPSNAKYHMVMDRTSIRSNTALSARSYSQERSGEQEQGFLRCDIDSPFIRWWRDVASNKIKCSGFVHVNRGPHAAVEEPPSKATLEIREKRSALMLIKHFPVSGSTLQSSVSALPSNSSDWPLALHHIKHTGSCKIQGMIDPSAVCNHLPELL